MTVKNIILSALSAMLLCACGFVGSLVHDDQVVARVGKEKLYRSELATYIPDGSSPEDSSNLALQYINSWAMERLYVKTAESKLSKEEKNIDRELEAYRRSLLSYRYEQHFISDRLDTLITRAQLEEYYNAHADALELPRPILKLRFVDLMSDSRNYDEILAKLSADGGQAQSDLDSLVSVSALRYFDSSEKWMDAAVVAREFGTDYTTMLSRLKDKYIIFQYDDRGETRAAYVFEIKKSGQAPLEYCEASIRDNILSVRKRDLMKNLEQDLLTDAQNRKDFVIYQND
ncbi:MAG: hypothetical protein IJ222_02995 [Bacteroidales bacterium]|nr:hypothetical protein [Bacteroidales bacterium]